jgi:putative zinc- or iron-chelating protein
MRGSQPRTAHSLRVVRALAPVNRFLLPPEIGRPPPEIVADLRAIAERVRLLTRAHLLRMNAETGGDIERTTAALDALGAELAAAYEKDFAAQRGRDANLAERLAAVECRKGCSFCCHMNVGVTALEAVRIAAVLRRSAGDARHGAVLAADDRFGHRGAQERLKLKTLCPLLADGACSVYELRPLACRALLSLSARLCELELEAREAGGAAQVPTLVVPRLIAAGYVSGEVAALDDLGLASHLTELTASVALLLREPTTLDRWLGGEDVFPRL